MNKKVPKRSKFILDKFPYILFGIIFIISIIIILSVRSCLPLPFFSGVTGESEEDTEYTLYIDSPINDKVFDFINQNETVPIEIKAKEVESTGYTIKVLVNDINIKSFSIPPYEYNWNPESAGEYEIVAQLIDDNGDILSESNTVNFTVRYEFDSIEVTIIDVDIEEKVNRILSQSNFIRNLNNTIPSGTPLLCYKCYTPPVIDGILQEWDKFYSFSNFYPTIMAEHYTRESDISGTFYSCWDDENFYFAVNVTDDVFSQNYQGNELFKGDSIAIAFDTELEEDMYISIYTGDDYLIYFSPGNFSGLYPECYISYPSAIPTDITVRSSRPSSNSYRLEASIPWDKFINYTPSDEEVLGFTVSIFDTDNLPSTEPKTELVISSSREFDKNDTSILGMIILIDRGDIQSEEEEQADGEEDT
jgi:hypothetical protein